MSLVVLIADADPERLDRMRRLVEEEGAVAVTATDAREAMRLFVRREPGLTLIQVDPSGELGLDFCRDMKTLRTGRLRSVCVVAPRESRPAAFDARCDAFVSRESDSRTLRRTVRRLLVSVPRSPLPESIELIA